jgi:DNA repair protein RecO (recombination protein O)
MSTYKTKAIVLSSYPYKEHDKIVTFYTQEYGKIEARARGTRKISSKLAGHLEPFIETDLLLAYGRRWDILAGSRTVLDFNRLRSNYLAKIAASVCVEAVKISTKPGARDRRIYSRLFSELLALEKENLSKEEKDARVVCFLWDMLSLLGFSPELSKCISCRAPIKESELTEKLGFSFEGGGILCHNCLESEAFFSPVAPCHLTDILKTPQSEMKSVINVVTGFWRTVIDFSELKSLRLWEDCAR